ncbi:sensor histidine kinase, partial [Staphylococcus chromogenes]
SYTFTFNTNQDFIFLNINAFHFEQILLIFFDNAIKYDTQRKKIDITTKYINNQVIIEITDHGMGIPQEDINYIFDRFYRVDKSRSRHQGGNGLGLSIAEKIVKLYQGHISVKSEVGKFTTFTISFNASQN